MELESLQLSTQMLINWGKTYALEEVGKESQWVYDGLRVLWDEGALRQEGNSNC